MAHTKTSTPPSLSSLTRPELIFCDLDDGDRDSVLLSLATRMVNLGLVSSAEQLCEQLREREALGTTGIGNGVAIPHCKVKKLDDVLVAVGVHPVGVDYDAPDGEPVKLLFLVLSPQNQPAAHLQSLAAISRWVQNAGGIQDIVNESEPEAVFDRLRI